MDGGTRDKISDLVNVFGIEVPPPGRIAEDGRALGLVQTALEHYFRSLSMDQTKATAIVTFTVGQLEQTSIPTPARERAIREILSGQRPAVGVGRSLERRAALIVQEIKPFVIGESVLDCGCGDGLVAVGLSGERFHIQLADVMNYLAPGVLQDFARLYPETALPYPDRSFDTVLLLTVLHHCGNPMFLLSEIRRVCRKRVIVIESIFGLTPRDKLNPLPLAEDQQTNRDLSAEFIRLPDHGQLSYCSFIDWFYNRILHVDVPVPFNYNTPNGWNLAFQSAGFRVVETYHLGIDQISVPEFHTLHVLDVP
jgi:SAM-dependent methyltransferase